MSSGGPVQRVRRHLFGRVDAQTPSRILGEQSSWSLHRLHMRL